MYKKATIGENIDELLGNFIEYQTQEIDLLSIESYIKELKELLEATRKIKINSQKIEHKIVAFGEIISAITLQYKLNKNSVNAIFKDARSLIFTYIKQGEELVDIQKSENATLLYFQNLKEDDLPIITGYIASNKDNETVTLGRNGSNYSATLIANFLNASEVQNWTDIDGIYTANPKFVKNAQKITHLSYVEANELANFGVNVLHPSTIGPLKEKNIPLKIFSSFQLEKEGTLIDENGIGRGIKAVSTIENISLITIEGKGLSGKVGIDGRIFSVLSKYNISVRVISQASSERGIGFVVNVEDAELCITILNYEFQKEIEEKSISEIKKNNNTAIIAIVGRHNYALEKAIKGLRRNKIWMYLISNSISGDHISLVIDNVNLKKAINVVHNHVFGAINIINLFAFGKGTVGSKLIQQILQTSDEIIDHRQLQINIIGIADSKNYIFNEDGITYNWEKKLEESKLTSNLDSIILLLKNSGLENIVIADNTTSETLSENYLKILNAGIDIVASNKKSNSGNYESYRKIRDVVKNKGRYFYYETNVGAGLPIIDTLKHLYNSADKITKIRGVFSGSLSYIFNQFSVRQDNFSTILLEAKSKGFTEPDAREDLSGMDVARKLIILAREIGFLSELNHVNVENLIPNELNGIDTFDNFIEHTETLNNYYAEIKSKLSPNEVLRYVGEVDVKQKSLKVSLINVPNNSPLGSIQNADAIFEIFTEGYGNQPFVIQGAGAGGDVTARGVYSDLIRIGENLKNS